ncbi:MAG TPA: LysM domain-containing protein [Aggregatilineaceae bacterium]|nr:LysM domain-containing protein [Aggregatilineaceae bacterium]
MFKTRVFSMGMIVVLVVSALAVGLPPARAQDGAPLRFVWVSLSCTQGAFSFDWTEVPETRPLAQQGYILARVEISDSTGTVLGAQNLGPVAVFTGGPFSGTISFGQRPVSPVTFKLLYAVEIPLDVRPLAQEWIEADRRVVEVDCQAAPGCDVQMPIPDTAVVGAFVRTTPAYWAPDKLTNPLVTIPVGKTAWVLGTDPSGRYYEIVWVCDLLWVPVNAMGPNYDDVWKGRPLPGRVAITSSGGSAGGTFPVDSAPTDSDTYTVQPGDNLFRIALHFGVNLSRLASVNGIGDPSRIYAGQVLNIAAAR